MSIVLLILAIAPPIAFMVFISWMDRHKPESMKHVVAAMALGALSTIPAIIIQLVFDGIPPFNSVGLTGAFLESFFLVAPSEEFVKFIFIFLFIRKKAYYSEINDGLVYYGAGAIGFALLENIFYVFDYGFSVGILRAFTSIPIHTFCGVIVGYHAGLAQFTAHPKPNRLIFRGLFIAYLTHALYNTLVFAQSMLSLFFIPLLVVVYYVGYKVLHRGRQLSMGAEPNLYVAPSPALPITPATVDQPAISYHSENVLTDSSGRPYLPPKKEKWKAFLSRFLLISNVLLWLLVFIADDTPTTEVWDLILGMVLLTIIPFTVGLLLERSYQRRKRNKLYLD